MLLKGKEVEDFLTDPNQIGQYVPGVEMIEAVEAHRKQNQAPIEIEAVPNLLTALRESL
jgi:hypothetical protein